MASVYVHFPFCRKRCAYCDFLSHENREALISPYLTVLENEIAFRAIHAVSGNRRFASLYIGGGTPSLLSPTQLHNLMASIRRSFPLEDFAEITIEVNPDSANFDLLKEAFCIGVNRLSIGVQSFNQTVLETLGRLHSVEQSYRTIECARSAGFSNLSIDLIFGCPNESLDDWRETLREAVRLGPEHVSCYSLTVEPDTPLETKIANGELPPVDNDLTAEMFLLAIEDLKNAGYEHYEISNFCRPDCYSRHNWNYWENGEYVGLGCGAFSYLDGERFHNTYNLDEYLSHPDGPFERFDVEVTTSESGAKEDLMVGLRKINHGVDLTLLERKRGRLAKDTVLKDLDSLIEEGLLQLDGNRLSLTPRGVLLADEVLIRLI